MKRPPAHGREKQDLAGAILHVQNVSVMLGCSEKAIRRRVERGLIPYRRLGGRIVFLRTELEQFLHDLPGVGLDEAKQNLALWNGEAQ